MRGVPWTDKVSPSILDVVIVIKASGIAMPIFRAFTVSFIKYDCILHFKLIKNMSCFS